MERVERGDGRLLCKGPHKCVSERGEKVEGKGGGRNTEGIAYRLAFEQQLSRQTQDGVDSAAVARSECQQHTALVDQVLRSQLPHPQQRPRFSFVKTTQTDIFKVDCRIFINLSGK